MTTASVGVDRKVRAGEGAQAWLNASIASGQDDSRPPLYRTLSVEFFRRGIQFVGCDGTVLFRTWAPYSDIGDLPAPHPEYDETPEDSVVVSDVDKFALGFMKTLLSALDDVPWELSISVEEREDEKEPALGNALRGHVLVLHALGQRLTCKLYDGPFPDWRRLQFGLDKAELVDGLTVSPRIFSAAGKLKGVVGVDCSFHGDGKAIEIRTTEPSASVRGLLMPMRRTRSEAERRGSEQTEHGDGEE
jgi:hypothetical protein